eukprot:CAMPEP_0117660554 /NCGR_PEP_ID=MMETSP0804-20121206/7030_1 /TAXON_ID=1074897 /ORGANISM="Tetraselmis astigmatica, Strain CCMP880" /LENGTH=42 /DNA_ID= /DNA_START= /DNA_END= /DNA_ORIENTATION=
MSINAGMDRQLRLYCREPPLTGLTKKEVATCNATGVPGRSEF